MENRTTKIATVPGLPWHVWGLVLLLEGLDTLTTVAILQRGGVEHNPLQALVLAHAGGVGFLVSKALFAGLTVLGLDLAYHHFPPLLPRHPWLAPLLAAWACTLLWLIVAFNLHWLLLPR